VTSTTMAHGLNSALRDAMTADPSVVVFGEDVAALGGVFRVTDGLLEAFGTKRCFDTPLAEAGIVGVAIGMAMNGFRPVVEMQFDAFAYPAFEQITSHVAKLANRSQGRISLPLVIRIPYGGGIGGVEHHSDSSEVYYTHTPGLTVVAPGTVADAYSLLRQSIDSPDPVIFLEPKRHYWTRQECELPVTTEPLRQAVVRRPGRDAVLIAYGPTVPLALAAAEAGRADGYDLEVLDLRCLAPFDDDTVFASVRRSGRAVVIQEAPLFCGYSAEVAARVSQACFHSLYAPVRRVGGFDIPYPPPRLEKYYLPNVDRILDVVSELQWEEERR
jgi:2-oxoisovalerate dehydrogenase E1 component beta subunit